MIFSVNNHYLIPNDPRPMPDELMYSYLNRLAGWNYIPAADFAGTFIYDKNKSIVPETVSHILYGNTWYIGRLTDILGYDPLTFFLEHSIYPGIAPLLIPTVQTRWINNVFRGNRVYTRLVSEIKPEISMLRYCPLCMKTEMSDYGFSWFHRKHQMPGVTACHVHKVKLVSLTKELVEKGLPDTPVYEAAAAGEIDFRYAVFARNFLDACISANWWNVRNAVLDALNTKINTPENEEFLGGNPQKMLRSLLKRNLRVDPEKILKALFVVFGEVSRIPCCESDVLRNNFMSASDGYILESQYSEMAVKMRKKEETDSFVTTPQGFIAGWRSPTEDSVSEDEKYKLIVRNMTAGAYLADGPLTRMDKKAFFIHVECGTRFSAVPSHLIEGITVCPCQKRSSPRETEIKRIVEGSGHYELIGYTGTNIPLTVRCLDCGHTFEVQWKTWKKQEGCRVCMREAIEKCLLSYSVSKWLGEENTDYDSRSVFEMRKQELVGDEFVIVSKYTDLLTPVKMLHRKCGNAFSIIPNYFLHGGRCPYCGYPHNKEFLRYIEVRSAGRYECVERSGMLYTLRDKLSGRVVTLRKLMIMQEFERLTPSEILPLAEKGDYELRKTNIEQVCDYIAAWYSAGKMFSVKDVIIPGLTEEQIYESIKKLVRKGILLKDGRSYFLNKSEYVR